MMLRPQGQDLSSQSSTTILCGICHQNTSNYACPQCKILYCSMVCFKSPEHESCSKQFLKKNVESSETETASQKKMLEILDKYTMEDDQQDDDVEKEPKRQWKYVPPESTAKQIEELKTKFGFSGSKKNTFEHEPSNDSDSDKTDHELTAQEERELEELVNGATEEQLLQILSPEQLRQFQDLIENGYYEDADSDDDYE